MQFKFPKKDIHPEDLIRRCGYGRISSWHTKETSYVRHLGRHAYPRFHAYVEDHDTWFQINLHLDQKQASYEGTSKHAGEYEGPVVDEEARRITGQIAHEYGISLGGES